MAKNGNGNGLNGDAKSKGLVSIGQASEILGVSIDTVRRWDKSGKLHSSRPDGKNRYFSVDELEKVKLNQPLSISEAAQMLKISASTLRRLEAKGLISPIRNGHGERLYDRQTLEKFLDSEYFIRQKEVEEEVLEPLKANGDNGQAENDEPKQPGVGLALKQLVSEHHLDIHKLRQRTGIGLAVTAVILVPLAASILVLTAAFLINPTSTSKSFGLLLQNKLSSDTKVKSASVEQGSASKTDSSVKFVDTRSWHDDFRPLVKMSLILVNVIDEHKYAMATQDLKFSDVNQVFQPDKDGKVQSIYTLYLDSNKLALEDQGLIVNLNADLLQGKRPGANPGDLAILPVSGGPGGSIADGTIMSIDIADGAITAQKLAPGLKVGGDTIVNNSGGGSGDIEEVVAGSGLGGGGASGSVTLNIGAGAGVTVNADDIAIDVTTSGVTSTTGSNSGLEASSDGVRLLGGCSNNQILKWNSVSQQWVCGADNAGGGSMVVEESDGSPSVNPTSTLQFTAGNFTVTDSGGGTALVNIGSNVLTVSNYAATLDPTYVNVGESPAAGDISGSFSVGLTVNANSVALGVDTTGNYVASFTAGTGLTGNATGEGSTPTINVVSANGAIVANTDNIALTLAPSTDGLSGTTSSGSGLEILPSGLALLQGCSDGQILKWNETTDVWSCAADTDTDTQGNAFTTVSTPAGTNPVADTATDTLSLLASGINLTITGADNPESVTFNIDESVLAGAGLAANGDALDIGAGNGITVNANSVEVDATTSGTTATTSSNSGIEATSSGLRLLGGCANGEVLKWASGSSLWSCSADNNTGVTDGDKGDITVSGGGTAWTIDPNSVALGTHTTGDYVASFTAGTGLTGNATGEGSTPTLNVVSANGGIVANADNLALTLQSSGDGLSSSTSSGSGMEILGGGLSLLQGCSDGQILKWNETTDVWSCNSDLTGGTINSFETIASPSGTNPVADNSTDTLSLTVAGANLTITGNSATDTLDFNIVESALAGNGLVANGDALDISTGNGLELSGDAVRVNQDFAFTWTNSHTWNLNETEGLAVNSTISGTNSSQAETITLTNSSTSGVQYGLYVDNAASTGTTDSLLVLDNSDADTAVTNAIEFINAGGGFTNLFNVAGTLISASEFNVLDGGIDLSTETSGNYVATITAGNGLTADATGHGSAASLAVGAGSGITANADDVAVNQNFSFTWTADHTWNLNGAENLDVTHDLAGSVDVLKIVGTPSGTAGTTRGVVIQQANHASNTNGLDEALTIDNADADLAVGTAIRIQNSGGGNYTNILDVLGTLISASELQALDGGIDLGGETNGDYVASFTAGNGLTGNATGEGSTPTLNVVSANGGIVANADNIALTLQSSGDGLSSTTSSGSGMEILSGGLTLLQGCANNEILKWNETTDVWACQPDATGGTVNSFETINAPSGTDPVADSSTDTLNLTVTGSNFSLTGTAGTDTLDFDIVESALAGNGLAANGDALDVTTGNGLEVVSDAVRVNQDFDFTLTGNNTFSPAGGDDFSLNLDSDSLGVIAQSFTGTTTLNGITYTVTNSSTSGTQNGIYIDNAASAGTTESLLVIDNSDTDTAVTNAIEFVDGGGGFTNLFNVAGVAISASEFNILDGGITLSSETNGDYVATITAGNGLTADATGHGSTPTLAVGAGSGITANADDVAVNQNFSFSWTADHTWTLNGTENLDVTSDLAGSVNVIGVVATPSGTAGTTSGLFIQQANHATNTNGLDSAISIDNADADLPVTAAIKIANTGGGGYTNIFDNAGTLISSSEFNILDGGIDLSTETSGNYVASFTAGNGLTGDASGHGSTPTIAIVSANGGIVTNADNIALTLQTSGDGLSSTTSSGSGLEILAGGLSMLQGCANNEILKWNETTDVWACSADVDTTANSFATIATPSGSNAVADSATDTLSLAVTGTNLTITGADNPESVTFDVVESALAGNGLVANGDALDIATGNGLQLSGDAVRVNQDFAFTWTADHTWNLNGTENLDVTSDLAGTVNMLGLVGTPSSTTGTTRGIFLQQANSANANGLDEALTIDNADADLAIPVAFKVTNSGGGNYTNIFDVLGTQISASEFNILDGGIDLSTETSGNYVATITAGNGLTADATGHGSAASLAVGAGSGITANADDIAVNQNFSFTWTADHTWNLNGTENLDVTSDLAGSVNVIGVVATPSTTAGTTAGLFLQQASSANTNGLDSALSIDNADNDLAITAAIKIANSGGGGYTNIFDNTGTLISGSELNVLDGGIDLGTETNNDYVASFTAGNGLTGNATGEGSTPIIAVVSANGGIVINADNIALTLAASTDGLSSTTSSGSGMEILASGLTLLQGCSDGQILKWNETTDVWACNSDIGSLTIRESDGSPSVGSVNTIEFGPASSSSDEFIVTDQTGGVSRITIGTQVGKLNEAETVTGGWTFDTNPTTFTTAINANGGVTTTTSNQALNFSANGSGDYVFALDSNTNAQFNYTTTTDDTLNLVDISLTDNASASTGTLYGLAITNQDNGANTGVPDAVVYVKNANAAETVASGLMLEQTGAGTLTNGLEIKRTAGTITNGLTFTGTFGTNLISAPNFTVTNGGAGTFAGNVAVNGGTITSTGTLTLDSTSTVIIPNADTFQTDDVTSTGGLTLTSAAASNIAVNPGTTGDVVFTHGDGSNHQITGTYTSDNTLNLVDVTLTDNASASTGTLYGLAVTNADNGANTGVPDAVVYVKNANAAETVASGLLLEQTGAGTLTNGLEIKRTAGTVTNGLTFTGTFGTNLISAPNFTVTNGGAGTFAGNIAVNGGTITSTGTLTLDSTSTVIIPNADSFQTDDVTSTGALTLTSAAASNIAVNPGTTGDVVFTHGDGSNHQISGTYTSDNTLNLVDVTLTDNASASTGTLYGLAVTNADNGANTGVPDAVVYVKNANAAETVVSGLLLEQTGAGTLTNGLEIKRTAGTVTNGLTFTGTFGTNLISAPNFTVTNGGAGTFAGNVAVNGGTITSTGTLTLDATSTTIIPDADTFQTNDVTSTSGLSLATGSNGNLSTSINGSGDLVVSLDADTNAQFSYTSTTDDTLNLVDISITDNAGASTGTLYGIAITNQDNGANTGVPDAIAYFKNANAAETVPDGLLVEQTGTGTLTNGLEIKRTAGTVTNGLTFTGVFGTNLISAPNFTVTNGGAGTFAGNVAVNGGTITSTGTLTLDSTSTVIIPNADSFQTDDVTSTGALTLTSAAASNIAVNPGTTGDVVFTHGDGSNHQITGTYTSDNTLNLVDVTLTDNASASTGTLYGLSVTNADNGANTGVPDAVVYVKNANAAETVVSGLLLEQTGAGTLSNGLEIKRTAGTVTNGLTFTGTFGTNLISAPNFAVTNGGAGTFAGNVAVNGGTITSTGTLTLDSTSTVIIPNADSFQTDDVTSTGALTLTSAAASNIAVNPGTTGDVVFTHGDGSNHQITGTYTSDNTLNLVDVTLTDNASASTGTLYGLAVTNADNGANTGVPDAVVYVKNANAAETVVSGLLLEQTGAGTLTNGLEIKRTAGTVTNGLTFTGTFGTNLINAGSAFTVTAAGAGTFGGNVAVNGGTITSTGTLTLDSTSTVIIPDADTFQTNDVTSTGGLTLATGANGNVSTSLNGSGDLVMSLDGDSNAQFTYASSTDATLNIMDLNITDNAGASTGTLYGLSIVNADNGANTGVPDALARLDNANTAEAVSDGLIITSSGFNNGIVDAIDVSAANIQNGINLGSNNIILNGDTINDFTGNGLTVSSSALTIALQAATSTGASSTTSSGSGLEVLTGGLTMLQGCSDTQILKWVEATGVWNCAADATGGAGSTTLNQAYTAGASSGDQTMALTAADGGGVIIQDAASTVGNLFTVQKSDASANYLNVTNSAITVEDSGATHRTALSIDITNHALKVFSADGTTNYASITATNTDATFKSNTGTTKVGSGSGAITIGGVGTTNVDITANAASTWQTTAGLLTIQGSTSGLTLTTATTGVLSLDTGTTGAINIGTTANAKAVAIGNSQSGSTTTITSTGVTTISNDNFRIRTTTNSLVGFQVQNAASTAILGVSTLTTGLNLIANSSFEQNINGWIAKATPTGGTPLWDNTASNAQFGSGTLKISVDATGDGASYAYPLKASTTYSISFYAKVSASSQTYRIGRQDNGSDGDCTSDITVTTSYQQFTCTFATGAIIGGASNFYIKENTTTAASTIFLDGLTLVESGTAQAYINPADNIQIDSNYSNITLNSDQNPEVQPWQLNGNTLPAVRRAASSVTANGFMYFIGGTASNGTSGAISRDVNYGKINADGSIGSWITLTNSLPVALYGHSSFVYNGYLYAIGGCSAEGSFSANCSTAVSTVYFSKLNGDGSLGTWQTNANALPAIRGYGAAVVANGFAYYLGGYGSGAAQSTAYSGKINADGSISAWTTVSVTALSSIRYGLTAVAANGNIYVMGGCSDAAGTCGTALTTVEWAVPTITGTLGSWTATTALPTATGLHGSAVLNGYIYNFGGRQSGAAVSGVVYSKISGANSLGIWSTAVNPLPVARQQAGWVWANNYAYILGGMDTTTTLPASVYYASGARVLVFGGLDLVGLTGQGLGDYGGGGTLTAGNTRVVGDLRVEGFADFNNGITVDSAININAVSATAGQTIFNINNSSSNSIFSIRHMGANFGSLATAGAFMQKNSYWGQEYNIGNAGALNMTGVIANFACSWGRGDSGGHINGATAACGAAASASSGQGDMTISASLQAATTDACAPSQPAGANGLERITATAVNTAAHSAVCAEYPTGGAAGVSSNFLTATNLPVMAMKIKPSTFANNTGIRLFAGMWSGGIPAIATTIPGTAASTWGVYFTNCTATTPTCANTTLQGWVVSASTTLVGSVSCPSALSTTNFAYLRIEFRTATEVHFYADVNTADGINEVECGTGVSSGSINAGAMTPFVEAVNSVNATGATTVLDVDYLRTWQDDNVDVSSLPQGAGASSTDTTVAPDGTSVTGTPPLLVNSAEAEDPNALFSFNAATSEDMVFNHDVYIRGTLFADKIKANQIEGLEIFTDKISSLQKKLADEQAASGSTSSSSTSTTSPSTTTLASSVPTLNITGGLTVGGDTSFHGNILFYKLVTFMEKTVFNNDVTFAAHVITAGGVPTITGGTAAGTPATPASIDGNDSSGQLTVNVGDGVTTGQLLSVNFNKTFDKAPRVLLTPANEDAAQAKVYVTATATGFKLMISAPAPSSGATLTFNYWIVQ